MAYGEIKSIGAGTSVCVYVGMRDTGHRFCAGYTILPCVAIAFIFIVSAVLVGLVNGEGQVDNAVATIGGSGMACMRAVLSIGLSITSVSDKPSKTIARGVSYISGVYSMYVEM